MLENLNQNERAKVKEWIDAGLKVKQEINDLSEGLKETTKALAEELEVKPAVLNKALRAAFKANIEEERDTVTQVEVILHAAGRMPT